MSSPRIVAFTGIREIDPSQAQEVEAAVLDVIAQRPSELRFGGALGADTLALKAAANLEFVSSVRIDNAPDIERVVFVPFTVAAQPNEAQQAIRAYASRIVEMKLSAGKSAYLVRNTAMITGADLVVAFTDGRVVGGTWYTMRRARELGIPVAIVPVESARSNPRLKGIDVTGQVWALEQYDRSKRLTQTILRNKAGLATFAEKDQVAHRLATLIRKTPALRAARAICAMPRRVPSRVSDMVTIAALLSTSLDMQLEHLTRIAEPTGGQVKAGRVRFPAAYHEATMRYDGPPGQTVIVLDNVLTSGGTMEGAIRAIRAAKCVPLGLAALYSDAFGAEVA